MRCRLAIENGSRGGEWLKVVTVKERRRGELVGSVTLKRELGACCRGLEDIR